MALSVQTTNAISDFTVDTILQVGSGALTAAVLYSPNLITPIQGGVFGLVQAVSFVAFRSLVNRCLNVNQPGASTNSKKLSLVIVLVASSALAGAAVGASGCALTAAQVALFAGANFINFFIVAFLMEQAGFNVS